MIAGQVGETAHREANAVDTAQRQRVTGHLHHHGVDAALGHHRQQGLQRGRLRRGQRARDVDAVDPHPDGADQPDPPPGRPQTGFDQVGRRRLARCAGDADDRHPLGRMPVHGGGELAQNAAGFGMDEYGHHTGVAVQLRQPGRIGEHRGGSAFDRVAVKAGAVCRAAGQRGKEVAGLDILSPQGHTGDRQIRRGAALGGNRPHLGGQRRERHAGAGGGTQRSGHLHHLRPPTGFRRRGQRLHQP